MPSRRLSVIVTIVIVVAFVVVAVAPAFAAPAPAALPAHAELVRSTPADASTVETATEVALEFTEDVNPDFVAVQVTGAGGADVTAGDPEVDGRTVTQALADTLPAGVLTVAYRVVSADGHPVAGTLTFTTTAAPTASAAPTGAVSAGPTETGSTPAGGDAGGGPWPVVGAVVALAVVALAVAWGVRGRRSGSGAGDPSEAEPLGSTRRADTRQDGVAGPDGGRAP